MKLINGLLDYSKPWTYPNVYLFTGNAVIKKNGAIVMGRGAAKQVRDTYPGIDKKFGSLILRHPNVPILWTSINTDQLLGWFQVKHHWMESAKLSIIEDSVMMLLTLSDGSDNIYHMNYPGIGYGGLHIAEVRPIVTKLPHNVLIYK